MKKIKTTLLVFSLLSLISCASNGSGDNVLNLGFTDLVKLLFSGDDASQTEPTRSEFHQAIVDGDLQTVRRMVDSETDINHPVIRHERLDSSIVNISAIGEAVKYNQTEIAHYLLAKGANPNLIHTSNPILFALDNNNNNLVKKLLEFDTDPDDINESEISLLMIAVDMENLEAVNMLLEYGANPNLATQNGDTALSIAKRKGNQAAQELIQKALQKQNLD